MTERDISNITKQLSSKKKVSLINNDETVTTTTYKSKITIDTIIMIIIILGIGIIFYFIHENVLYEKCIDITILKAEGCPMCKNVMNFIESLHSSNPDYYKITLMNIDDFILSLSDEMKKKIQSVSVPLIFYKVGKTYRKIDNKLFLQNYSSYLTNLNKNTTKPKSSIFSQFKIK